MLTSLLNDDYFEFRPHCPLCRGSIRLLWAQSNFYECLSCGLRFRNPPPSRLELAALYGQSWLRPNEHPDETGSTGHRLAKTYAHRLAASLGAPDFRGMKLLEIGAGRGALMKALAEYGADVCAVEPFGYRELRAEGLIAYRCFEDLPENVQFDGVISMEVVEHMGAPWEDCARVQQLLKDSGWFFISTPNPGGLNAQLSGVNWREARKQAHLMFFGDHSMRLLLNRCGFSAVRRLHWFVQYGKSPIPALAQYGLQLLRIDGELRFLARRA